MDRKRKLSDGDEFEANAKRIKYEHDNYVSIEQIPNEVLLIILTLIGEDDKNRRILRLVSRRWFHLINYSHFEIRDKSFTNDEGEAFIQVFDRHEQPFSLYFPLTNQLVIPSSAIPLWRLTNLIALDTPYLPLNPEYTSLIALTSLEVKDINEKSMAVLQRLTKLRTLRTKALHSLEFHLPNLVSLEYRSLRHHKHAADSSWPLLTQLYAPWMHLLDPKQAPNIKHLTVLSEFEQSDVTRKCYTGLETLVSRRIMFDELPLSLTRLEFSYKMTRDQTAMIERLTNLKVLLIEMHCSSFNVSAMTNLESFAMEFTNFTKSVNHRFLEQIQPDKLTRLHYAIEAQEQMNTISRLTALRELSLIVSERFRFDNGELIYQPVISSLTRLTHFKLDPNVFY